MDLAIRAIREGITVLRVLGYPIVPESFLTCERIPESILVWVYQKRLRGLRMQVAMLEHAKAAQDEVKHLADEFIAPAKQTTLPTPYIDRQYSYFGPTIPPLPEGSAQLPLNWWFMWVIIAVMAGGSAFAWLHRSYRQS